MSEPRDLPELFSDRVVVFDGAVGSLLIDRGISHLHPLEELNLSSPDPVRHVHEDYIRAGASAIETNTFAANRFRLSVHGIEDRTREINLAGALIAREAAGAKVVVAGSIGPLGVKLEPIGSATLGEVRAAVIEQVGGLVEGGVDLLLLETQSDVELVRVMLETIFDEYELPVICQFAVGSDLTTSTGDTLDDIASRLSDYPVGAIGFNCSVGPEQTLRAVMAFHEISDLPISAQPNSGFPAKVDGRTLFVSGPAYFAERAVEMVRAGASIVGGCCGTTPAHIAAVAEAVKDLPKPEPSPVRSARATSLTGAPAVCERSPLLRRMNGDFVTVEVTPPKDTNYRELVDRLRPLVEAGVSAIDVTDNPMARMHMSGVAFAHLLKTELGVATILHLTCRDLNLLGMHSTLLGAAALGVDGILALTGDPASSGDYPAATSVFDVTSDGLARIISSLNCGVDYMGKEIGKPTSFAIGGALNPMAEDIEKELARLEKKREAGVNFLMTQPVFDLAPLEAAVKKLPEGWRPPILVGVIPLRSSRHAEFLHNEVPGITIPQDIRDRLAALDGDAARAEGVRIAREIYQQAKRRFGGTYFMPPFGNPDVVREILVGRE